MNRKIIIYFIVLVFLFSVNSLFAEKEVKRLGVNPFYRSKDLKAEDIQTIANDRVGEVKIGFEEAGYGDLFFAFIEQLKSAQIEFIEIQPGDTIMWMMFKRGKRVYVEKDVIWAGKKPFLAYRFVITRDLKEHVFIVPKICGNISLKSTTELPPPPPPPPPPNQPPTCDLQVNPTDAFAGELITLDASGSSDPDGKIVSVKFTINYDNGELLEEKVLETPPWIYETKIKKAGTYKLIAVVKDNDGAEINGENCQKEVFLKKRGFIVGDLGILYMPDPATWILARVGYMYKFSESVSIIGLVGAAPEISDSEDDTTAILGDVTLTFWLSKFFVGAGVGVFHTSVDTRFDLIINTGFMFAKHVGLFVEGRVAFDEFSDIQTRSRYGGGLRIIF
ncbi:MAG: hypothetical protein KAS65_05225 [Candidatus Aminicenantes bacterium]|nr:hypothetical protein [Candidatus Aminicenantes bacterium]